jgi:O-antigen ligase
MIDGGIRRDRGGLLFWLFVLATQLLVALAAFRSPVLAIALAGAVGVLALLALAIGTRSGTLLIAGFLVVVTVCLPGDVALQYRLPVGGGGIFIVDFILALLLASLVLYALAHPDLRPLESPVRLPFLLFVVWVATAAVVGFLRGNEFKLILQDGRALAYYLLFFVVILLVNDRRTVLWFLRLLALSVPVVFAIGAVFAALGQGMRLEYVEPGVSRFPAPDDVFLMSSVMTLTFVAVWPAGRPRPRWLWALLLLSLLGLVLSLVRGNWLAFAVAVLYLLVILRVRERFRLIALGAVVLVVLTGVLAVAQPAVLRSVVSRALAVTAVNDRNVQWRLIENRAVGAQIKDSPWVGNGLGKDYLFDWSRYGVEPYRKSYIHNAYYWFVHRLGIVGMVLFAWLALAFLLPWMKARAALPRDDPWLLGLIYGGRALLVSLLVVSITSPRIADKLAVTVLGLVMGLSEVALWLLKTRASDAEGETPSQAVSGRASGSG